MSAPLFRGIGINSSTEAETLAVEPTALVIGDLQFVEVESKATDPEPTMAENWAQVPDSPQIEGNTRLQVFYQIYSGNNARTITQAGTHDHMIARMISFIGYSLNHLEPFNASAGTTQAATKAVETPGLTTTASECTVVAFASGNLPDSNSIAQFSGQANASLLSCTERLDVSRAVGDGGALWCASGVKKEAGEVSPTTATAVTEAERGCITLAINPRHTLAIGAWSPTARTDLQVGEEGAKWDLTLVYGTADLGEWIFLATWGEGWRVDEVTGGGVPAWELVKAETAELPFEPQLRLWRGCITEDPESDILMSMIPTEQDEEEWGEGPPEQNSAFIAFAGGSPDSLLEDTSYLDEEAKPHEGTAQALSAGSLCVEISIGPKEATSTPYAETREDLETVKGPENFPIVLSHRIATNPEPITVGGEWSLLSGMVSIGASLSALGPQKLFPDEDLATAGWTETPLSPKISDESDATTIKATLS